MKERTLAEAQAWLKERQDKGEHCPCCGQFSKIYKRKLNSAMAATLIFVNRYFAQHPEAEWLHVERYLKGIPKIPPSLRGDFPKLRYWNLLEAQSAERDDGNPRVGMYRITEKGKRFVRGKVQVPKQVILYNQGVLGFSEESLHIVEALGEHFDYDEMMYRT
jgi:hypothetical protein